jgi:hypothetical protein
MLLLELKGFFSVIRKWNWSSTLTGEMQIPGAPSILADLPSSVGWHTFILCGVFNACSSECDYSPEEQYMMVTFSVMEILQTVNYWDITELLEVLL